ncbi:orotidine 5'-phosphate decarboxylase [Tilletia horrida]|nr:orotidine 5'-phosphate decarboxylase [Tilletia horrida]
MAPSKRQSDVAGLNSSDRAPKTRRALFTPTAPPLATDAATAAKHESDSRALETQNPSPSRYSLRVRARSSGNDSEDVSLVKLESPTTSPKKAHRSFFDVSPRKSNKPIKRELEAHELHPAPPRWKETYSLLLQQRRRIVAPVDTLGCEEAGNDERRGDKWREESSSDTEDVEERERRKRFTTLVSLMLSSQTKDPVTAAAVANLQRQLPGGLTVDTVIAATDDQISQAINKVGFWRRKTGYVKSAALILKKDFNGDIPRDVDEICSLPGVGPKMAYLLLQSAWQMNEGIGVDVHVHRISNRLGWHRPPTKEAEQTRLNLQSWLPKPLHTEINRVLVGFGQVVCLPVSPRCDLCVLATAKLCPSRRKVDPKSIESRVKVEFLPEDDGSGSVVSTFPHKFRYHLDWDELDKPAQLEAGPAASTSLSKLEAQSGPGQQAAATLKLEGPNGSGTLLAGPEEVSAAIQDGVEGSVEVAESADAPSVKAERQQANALEW